MRDINLKKYSGPMMIYKAELDNLLKNIKTLEDEIDSKFQKAVFISTYFISLSSHQKEIQLASNILEESLQKDDLDGSGEIVKFIRNKIYEIQNLIVKHLIKSLLDAIEALAEAEKDLLIFGEYENLLKIIDKSPKGRQNDKGNINTSL